MEEGEANTMAAMGTMHSRGAAEAWARGLAVAALCPLKPVAKVAEEERRRNPRHLSMPNQKATMSRRHWQSTCQPRVEEAGEGAVEAEVEEQYLR